MNKINTEQNIYTADTNNYVIMEKFKQNIAMMDEWCCLNFAKINYSKTEFMIMHKINDKSTKEELERKVGDQIIKRVLYRYIIPWNKTRSLFKFQITIQIYCT